HLQDSLQFYAARKDSVGLDELQQLFQLFLELENQLKSSAFPKACFEMALVQACRVQPLVGVPELLQRTREMLRGAPAGGGRPPPRPPRPRAHRPPPEPPRAAMQRPHRPPAAEPLAAAPNPTLRTPPPGPPTSGPSTPTPRRSAPPAGRVGTERNGADDPED